MSLLSELEKQGNRAFTGNGALSNASTLDPVLDFFSKGGAKRQDIAGAQVLFEKAYSADNLSAIRTLFYLRDVRGGQGERDIFRACLQRLEDIDPDIAVKVLPFIAEYGRYDDMFSFRKGETLAEIAKIVNEQLMVDESAMKENGQVSLLAKWLPSENASSRVSRGQARALAQMLGVTERQYRMRLSALRKYIGLLEQKMSTKQWAEIRFDKLPSQAHKKHVKAFYRHDEERYKEYLASVVKGEAKINAGTLFAYQLYDMVRKGNFSENKAADALWKNLPDYTNGTNALVLADVSGSMSGFPMSVSVSLALYFAERNEGPFKDYFMTFTGQSKLQHVRGNTLAEKMRSIETANWDGSTNLQSAFDAILTAAQNAKATAEEMPAILYIISDMQFNQATSSNNKSNFDVMKEKYRNAGYQLPHVVFWNANAWGNDTPATKYEENVTLISGANQSAFQYAVQGKTPIQSMVDILTSDRYNKIVIA